MRFKEKNRRGTSNRTPPVFWQPINRLERGEVVVNPQAESAKASREGQRSTRRIRAVERNGRSRKRAAVCTRRSRKRTNDVAADRADVINTIPTRHGALTGEPATKDLDSADREDADRAIELNLVCSSRISRAKALEERRGDGGRRLLPSDH